MELCEKFGIPHSQLLGADGTWTALDRAKALAWAAWQRSVCPGCHTRMQEWDRASGGDPHAYVTDTLRCPGCELIEQERDHVPQGRSAYGVKIQLLPRHQHHERDR